LSREASDERLTSRANEADRIMIPWHYVLGLGLPDVQSEESTIGFKAGAGTTLVDSKGEVE
jgi:hypothetical protein